jgi:hypothetical protein
MNLLERYLYAVRSWLPKAQQEDIIQELSEDLRSEIERREAEMGGSLETDEIEALLRRRGHPVLVATRFLPRQYLIGPAFFPAYRYVLKMLFLFVFIPVILISFIPTFLASEQPLSSFFRVLSMLWTTVLYTFGLVTVIFVLLERGNIKCELWKKWSPSSLPPAPPVGAELISRGESLFELLVSLCVALFLVGIWPLPLTWNLASDGVAIEFSRRLSGAFWMVLALTLANAALAAGKLYRPYWRPLYSGVALAADAAVVAIGAWLLQAGVLIEVTGAVASAEKIAVVSDWINLNLNLSLAVTFIIAAVVHAVDGITHARRILQARKPRAGMATGLAAWFF